MHRLTPLLPLLFFLTAAAPPDSPDGAAEASRVTITRDDWGIAHVHGKSDADAVFGMIYAQAEDDFPRIEANYLTNLGRTAEAEGEKAIWQDLRARLYVSDSRTQGGLRAQPGVDAQADGRLGGRAELLPRDPSRRPSAAIKRFEPWMALSFTEGSIGGDIERIDLDQLEAFYSGKAIAAAMPPKPESQGSNGIAIAPSITSDGHALLLINPHTSHYFRSEAQVTSDEGLNVYGASTWGQFFVYQGFNAHAGWMHTSSGVDSVDEFADEVERRGKGRCYRYGNAVPSARRAAGDDPLSDGRRSALARAQLHDVAERITDRSSASEDGRWIAFAMMNRPVEAIQQSFWPNQGQGPASFMKIANLKANSSNDTIFADDKGEIAYLHPQFVPRRDNRFDYKAGRRQRSRAPTGAAMHALSELPSVISPPNGWVRQHQQLAVSARPAPTARDPQRLPEIYGHGGRKLPRHSRDATA